MKFDDIYSSYEDEELEIKMALKSVISDEKVVNEAVKHYQMGKSQDLIIAEQMLLKGACFNTVDKAITSNIKKRTSARPAWDTKLRKALVNSKSLPDKIHRYEAHHIVAKCEQRAKRAAEILYALGIDIDDVNNGVFLPKDEASKKKGIYKKAFIHGKVHTNAYYANVNMQIVNAFNNNADKSEMIELLNDIAQDLQNGVYPINQFMPGAEAYT